MTTVFASCVCFLVLGDLLNVIGACPCVFDSVQP